MKRLLYYIFFIATVIFALTACIDDSFSDSPADQPSFSVDTLDMGVVFTEQMTTTHRFTVKNGASRAISISDISLSGDGADYFRLNVDGFSGREFHNVEIRAKDSIFVFVEATLPLSSSDIPLEINANVDFKTNGVSKTVVLTAYGQDVIRLSGLVINEDTVLDSSKPYQIFDSLVVAKNTKLTINPGVSLRFHDGAYLAVDGTLDCRGTSEAPVIMTGDRTGNVVGDITFDLMSRQWQGLFLGPESKGNTLSHTIIKNTEFGVVVDCPSDDNKGKSLSLLNCRFRNSATTVLASFHAQIEAVGCEFAEGGGGLVALVGGMHDFTHCTFANYYLFSALGGPAIYLSHTDISSDDESGRPYMYANVSNSIIYGLGYDISHGDLSGTDVYLRNCLLKSNGTDDDNFINCVWNEDPLYYTVRNEYIFDYRLRNESPAIGKADPELTPESAQYDWYGSYRGLQPDLGAYVYVPAE